MDPHTLLRSIFGYTEFRPLQHEVITSILEKQDVLAILPTGAGKSMCYQIPGLLQTGTALVISPLISLMKDQVDDLNKKGIAATYINSSLEGYEQKRRLKLFQLGRYHFVYVSPEKLINPDFLSTCQRVELSMILVDEAHCISEWGHDFRPSYRLIVEFIEHLKQRPVIAAFTATATPVVQRDICDLLQLRTPKKFLQTFRRENLFLWARKLQSAVEKEILLFIILQKYIQEYGIIYCATQEKVEEVATLLSAFHFSTAFYHGGLSSEEKSEAQRKFMADEMHIMVATNAFGMGVNKKNIRFVIHYGMPLSIEAYYQEVGRNGRDGIFSRCFLLFTEKDIQLARGMKSDVQKLNDMVALVSQKACFTRGILSYFGEQNIEKKCSQCSSCRHIPIALTQKQIEVYRQLLRLRKKSPHVLTLASTVFLALFQPQTKEECLKISGIGLGFVEKYFEEFSALLTAATD